NAARAARGSVAMTKLAAALALTACMLAAPALARAQSPMGAFCGLRRSHPSRYHHVLWIWMENHSFGQIVGSSAAPYINSVIADCSTFDVPYTDLQTDLDNDTLPAFAFVTPNTIHDMHDGPDPIAIQNGDMWLSTELPKILNSAAYQAGRMVVFITFDEGAGGGVGEDCAANPADESCHVVTIVVSPSTPPGATSDRPFTHYALLKTTEQLLGVRRLGLARRARSMRHAFRL